jgi:riboflavin-specific deaminase-like protein
MRGLLPEGSSESVLAGYTGIRARAGEHSSRAGRPYVVLNMVSSVDGAIALDGVSAGLSGADDKAIFFLLRSLADVVLVGAGTAREENYGRVRLSPELLAARHERGQLEPPRIALVSKSMQLDPRMRLFTETRPYVICPADTPIELQEAATEVADVILAGDTDVDLVSALRQLGESGAELVLCEGGPMLNGQLLAAGLVDELCLTLSPTLVGGTGQRITGRADVRPPLGLEVLGVAEAGGMLLLRYAVKDARQA